MRKKPLVALGALCIAAALSLTACSGNGNTNSDDGSPKTVPTTQASGKTLTVWAMHYNYGPETLKAIKDEFTKVTGAKVNLQIQEWDGITTKVSTALATSSPPDVVDLGSTQIAGYAANGGLLDLTPYKADLQQKLDWLPALEDPATIDGKLYGVPGYAGNRVVIYNKTLWDAAGVTTAPKTYEELTSALDKVKQANATADFSPFYLPGQYWYAALQWVWDAGGEIATQSGGTWTGGFSSAKAQDGLKAFKKFQNTYSSAASQSLDTDKPDQDKLFADGKTSAIVGLVGETATIVKDNPQLTDADLGTFPLPGMSGKSQPVFVGGGNWGVATKSKNKDLALLWTKIAASPTIQNTYVFGKDGWIPNSAQGIKSAQESGLAPLQKAFFAAALNAKATPSAANWAKIEGDKSINQFFSTIATGGKSTSAAAKDFDAHIDSVLNGK